MVLSQLFRRPAKDASGERRPVAPSPSSERDDPTSFDDATDVACKEADSFDLQGMFWHALRALDDALTRAPNDPVLYFRRGTTLLRWGRAYEAKEASLHAAKMGLASEALYRQICWCWCWLGSPEEGKPWMAKAGGLAPDDWRTQCGLGIIAHLTQQKREAVEHLQNALSKVPDNAAVLNILVVCHLGGADPASAEKVARRAIEVQPGEAMAWANLGTALARQLRFDEAWPAFDEALRLESANLAELDVFVNYCSALRYAGRLDDCIRLYERSLAEVPSASGHGDYAFALLSAGRLKEGWKQYEYRWVTKTGIRRYPRIDGPMWNGQDLRGRTMFLWVEQGFGDIIQFVRYAPLLKAMGARVVLMAREGFGNVLQSCPGIDQIITKDEELPAFDFHCPLMSLPRVFGTTVETIPAPIPYLRAEPDKLDKWRRRLPAADRPRVGLVWAGSPDHPNDRERSIPLASLRPLLACDGVSFISLQKGPPAAQLEDLDPAFDVYDLGSEIQDFGDTLAVIEQLDLVVCVDTSVAHLAGAAGKSTWLFVTNQADFRWMEGRSDSPWYPSVRLFRQDRPRDWTTAIAEAARALPQWVAGRGEAIPAPPSAEPPPREVDAVVLDTDHRPGFSDVAFTRYGVLQYFPEEPAEGCSLRVYGEYLQAQVDLLPSLMGANPMVLDVRPGIGAHTVALSRLIGAEGRVLAFEPDKRKHRVVCRNIAANGLPNISVLMRDLGAECQLGLARNPISEDMLTTGSPPNFEGAVDTMDSLRLLRLDFVKIDDGSVADDVLSGGSETLWRCRPRLLVSVLDRASAERVADRMRMYGYRAWLHQSPLFNSANFNLVERDLFPGQTALAVVGVPEEMDLERPLTLCSEMT